MGAAISVETAVSGLSPAKDPLRLVKIRSSRSKIFCKKVVLKIFRKFTGKHLYHSFFFNKVAGLRSAILLKKRFWHRGFPVSFKKFLRTPFLIDYLWWLLQENAEVWFFSARVLNSYDISGLKSF